MFLYREPRGYKNALAIWGRIVKLLTEYLERAIQLEEMAENEPNSAFKDQLLQQAEAYRKLAAKRAKDYGLPAPSPPEKN